MREKLYVENGKVERGRITPACAGKTFTRTPEISSCQDHPRVCGKNVEVISPSVMQSGSPPRVREKLNSITDHPKIARITPACAGKTE